MKGVVAFFFPIFVLIAITIASADNSDGVVDKMSASEGDENSEANQQHLNRFRKRRFADDERNKRALVQVVPGQNGNATVVQPYGTYSMNYYNTTDPRYYAANWGK